jgi:hypothetical protein
MDKIYDAFAIFDWLRQLATVLATAYTEIAAIMSLRRE